MLLKVSETNMEIYCVAVMVVLACLQIYTVDSRVQNAFTRRATRDCYIPSGPLYRRAVYRRRYGPSIAPLRAGARVSHNTMLVVVCRQDRVDDAILRHSGTTCRYGRWRPPLPKCLVKKRCRAPNTIVGARPVERIPPSVTYRHGRTLKYKCEGDRELVGEAERACKHGTWSKMTFKCLKPAYDFCNNMTVKHGTVTKSVKSSSLYKVECETGFQLKSKTSLFPCKEGHWLHHVPRCNPVSCPVLLSNYNITECSPYISTCRLSDLVHGTSVSIRCRKYQLALYGVYTAKCVTGSWKPSMPTCRATCRLPSPRRTLSVFRFLKTGKMASGRINHMQRIRQTCKRAPNGASVQSVCVNGRWRPRLMRCRRNTRMSSYFLGCTLPVDVKAEYMDSKHNIVHESMSIPHGRTIWKVCIDLNNTALNGTWQSTCSNGTWAKEFTTCPSPERVVTCSPPAVVNVTYEPLRENYQVDDSVFVTGCTDKRSFPAGSPRMRCMDDGTWFGSVQCLEYCENGQQTVDQAVLNVSNITEDKKHHIGPVQDYDECIAECLQYTDPFLCRAVQVFIKPGSHEVDCVLLAKADVIRLEVDTLDNETAEAYGDVNSTTDTSNTRGREKEEMEGRKKGKMENREKREIEKVTWNVTAFVRNCDERCFVPTSTANSTIYTTEGQTMVPNQLAVTGTTIEIECEGSLLKSMYSTCMGGVWSHYFNSSFCEQ